MNKHLLVLITLLTFGIVSCSNEVTLVCDCYKTNEFYPSSGKLVDKECGDSKVFGYSTESLVFNEKEKFINWSGYENIGFEKRKFGITAESELEFEDKKILFNYRSSWKINNGNDIEDNYNDLDLNFNRVSLVAEERRSGTNSTAVTRFFKCKVAESV